jgi:hypothetical protein
MNELLTTTRTPSRLSRPALQARRPLHLDNPKQHLKNLQPSRIIRHAAQVLDARVGLKDRSEEGLAFGAVLNLVRGDFGERFGKGDVAGHCGVPYLELWLVNHVLRFGCPIDVSILESTNQVTHAVRMHKYTVRVLYERGFECLIM